MNILFFLIPLSLLILVAIVWAFIWAVNHGQFEDLDRAAYSILHETDEPERAEREASSEATESGKLTPGDG